MRGNELLDRMDLADPVYVEAADSTPQKRKKEWSKWLAVAACLCLVVGIGANLASRFDWGAFTEDHSSSSTGATTSPAYGFLFNDAWYFPIDFEARERFGLVGQDSLQIEEDDLGEYMGSAEIKTYDGAETMTTIDLYHYAAFPDSDTICIGVYPDGVKGFYVIDSPVIAEETRATSDGILDAYHVPESVSELLVQTGAWVTKLTITDTERIEAICAILRGKSDMGLKAHERLYAQAWYDAYGNTDVYYDEETERMVYKSDPNWEPTEITFTDEQGNEVTRVEPDEVFESTYDAAHALWGKNERVLTFTTERGQWYVFYTPSIKTFSSCDGYYALSDAEVQEMNRLLEIE